ncbi:MAG: nucleotidyltransferase domain-containing protein [Firmicutes bacterium]|nr:nucleotidyltransferase domain-containing protein [Bacillota bacterium]
MMTDKIYTIEEIKEKIQPLITKYRLKKVSLFGSYARGEATEKSDIDLYIIDSPDSYDGIPWAIGAIFCDFEDALDKNVDIVTAKSLRRNWDMWSTRMLFKNIKKDEVILYERRTPERYERTGTYD